MWPRPRAHLPLPAPLGHRLCSAQSSGTSVGGRRLHEKPHLTAYSHPSLGLHIASVRRGRADRAWGACSQQSEVTPSQCLHPLTQLCHGSIAGAGMSSCYQSLFPSCPSLRSPPTGRPPGSGISGSRLGCLKISSQTIALLASPKTGSSVAVCPSAQQGARHPRFISTSHSLLEPHPQSGTWKAQT